MTAALVVRDLAIAVPLGIVVVWFTVWIVGVLKL